MPTKNSTWHFAFAYKRNKLLAIGQNDMSRPDCKALKFAKKFGGDHVKWPTRHAEIDVICRLWGRTYIDRTIKLILIRLNKFGELGNSKPCYKCQVILDALNVNKIYFTIKGKIEKL